MLSKIILCLAALLCMTLPHFAHAQISSPSDLSNLVFWVDGQDINGTGIQPADGSVVTTWVDKSTGGNNLTTAAGTVTYEATGFDGINPGLRFPLIARMAAAKPFASDYQNEMTVFFVNANVTATTNFSVNLNGTNTGNNSTNGRFSFHTPWGTTGLVYFDGGGCCGSTRLSGASPNALTETTLYTGLNDEPGNQQLFRIDGQVFKGDTTGLNANVSGGIHIGDTPNAQQYDGRFAEMLIYDRALSLTEIRDVECLLMSKWKPSDLPSDCTPSIAAKKTVEPWNPTGLTPYSLPGNDVTYTIEITHENGPDLDSETVFLVDSLASETIFYNGDVDDTGPEVNPVGFSNNGSGLTFDYATDVGYSDSATKPTDMSLCNYVPSVGYDAAVNHVCIKPTGTFNSGTPAPSFAIFFRTQIK